MFNKDWIDGTNLLFREISDFPIYATAWNQMIQNYNMNRRIIVKFFIDALIEFVFLMGWKLNGKRFDSFYINSVCTTCLRMIKFKSSWLFVYNGLYVHRKFWLGFFFNAHTPQKHHQSLFNRINYKWFFWGIQLYLKFNPIPYSCEYII